MVIRTSSGWNGGRTLSSIPALDVGWRISFALLKHVKVLLKCAKDRQRTVRTGVMPRRSGRWTEVAGKPSEQTFERERRSAQAVANGIDLAQWWR
jgi:hypothetical protein